jgi:hypothetical protein
VKSSRRRRTQNSCGFLQTEYAAKNWKNWHFLEVQMKQINTFTLSEKIAAVVLIVLFLVASHVDFITEVASR